MAARTLISMLPTLADERRMGRPTSDGKMCAGKFWPANPHLTKPVPLSHTTILLPWASVTGADCKARV